ncbi:MAG: secretin N-terminal domain-containing protein [Acidobacteriota bacterium]
MAPKRSVLQIVFTLALLFAGLVAGNASAAPQETRSATERWLDAHRNPAQPQYFGEPISLSLKDADLVEVLRSFAEIGQFNLVLQPGIHGKVTVELKDVPWDQALAQILKINGLGLDITGGKVRVGRGLPNRPVPSPALLTVSLQLQYADAEVVARGLQRPQAGIPGPGGSIVVEPARNQLILRDRREVLRTYGRILTQVDIPSAAHEDPKSLEARCQKLWEQLEAERKADS